MLVMLRQLFFLLAVCLLTRGSPVASRPDGDIIARTPPRKDDCCSNPPIKAIDLLLRHYRDSEKLCSAVLRRSRPSPVVVTRVSTVTLTSAAILTGVSTTTSISGLATSSTVVTTTERETSLAISTIYTTITSTAVTTISTQTFYATETAPAPNALTVTTTVTTHAAALYKRAAATNLGKLYPGCPKALANVALKVASTACSCFLGPVVTPTSTFASVTTSTLRITLNSISTETAVIPSSTTTITQTVTETSIVLIESFITQTSTDASTISAVASTTITSTITPPAPTATETITITNRYQVVTGPKRTAPGCTYNRYVDFPSVGNDPGPNNDYSGPINECKSLCDRRADCKFALYLRFDPATARGFDGGACILDNEPYDQSFLQCSYPVQFYAGWNRL